MGMRFLIMPAQGDGRFRKEVRPGQTVDIIMKQDQRNGRLTRGVVREILTNSAFHPHGIKVRLQDGRVGRVGDIPGENLA